MENDCGKLPRLNIGPTTLWLKQSTVNSINPSAQAAFGSHCIVSSSTLTRERPRDREIARSKVRLATHVDKPGFVGHTLGCSPAAIITRRGPLCNWLDGGLATLDTDPGSDLLSATRSRLDRKAPAAEQLIQATDAVAYQYKHTSHKRCRTLAFLRPTLV